MVLPFQTSAGTCTEALTLMRVGEAGVGWRPESSPGVQLARDIGLWAPVKHTWTGQVAPGGVCGNA